MGGVTPPMKAPQGAARKGGKGARGKILSPRALYFARLFAKHKASPCLPCQRGRGIIPHILFSFSRAI